MWLRPGPGHDGGHGGLLVRLVAVSAGRFRSPASCCGYGRGFGWHVAAVGATIPGMVRVRGHDRLVHGRGRGRGVVMGD